MTGTAIIGGVFAENSNYPEPYNGGYFFGDFSGWVRVLTINANNQAKAIRDFDTGITPVQFRMGPEGNVYVLGIWQGALYRYVYTSP